MSWISGTLSGSGAAMILRAEIYYIGLVVKKCAPNDVISYLTGSHITDLFAFNVPLSINFILNLYLTVH